MITLRSKMQNPPWAVCDYQVEKDGRYGWFLCVWHPESNVVLEEIQAEIKLEIMNSDIRNVSKIEADKWLKNFFADFHWRLHASLRKMELKEKGLSLFLGIMYENEIYFVQFGRMYCALGSPKKVTPIGKSWENSHLQTMEQMNLLGMSAEEIRVRPQKILVPEHHFLLVLPAFMARDLFDANFDPSSVNALLGSLGGNQGALWLLLTNEPEPAKTKRKRFSRLHIATALMLVITILAILYVSFGGRFLEMTWHRARMLFQSKKPIPLQEIPSYLKIENEKMRGIIEQALKSPARDVELKLAWSTDLPYQVTAAPGFDLDNIYLASQDQVLAFHKKERNLLWNQSFGSKIMGISNTGNLILISLQDQRVLGLNNKGETLWEQTLTGENKVFHSLKPIEINNGSNPRLDGSLMVLPSNKSITALNPNTGEKYSELTFNQDLQYLSAYDSFQSCFYAVVKDAIICVELKVLN